jgi:hypothetical protein
VVDHLVNQEQMEHLQCFQQLHQQVVELDHVVDVDLQVEQDLEEEVIEDAVLELEIAHQYHHHKEIQGMVEVLVLQQLEEEVVEQLLQHQVKQVEQVHLIQFQVVKYFMQVVVEEDLEEQVE